MLLWYAAMLALQDTGISIIDALQRLEYSLLALSLTATFIQSWEGATRDHLIA